MDRQQALQYVEFAVDDALSPRTERGAQIPALAKLVGWNVDSKPVFVAVWSYLPSVQLTDDEAVEIAIDYINEIGAWIGRGEKPDYIL